LRIKEQETRLTLQEHDDDDNISIRYSVTKKSNLFGAETIGTSAIFMPSGRENCRFRFFLARAKIKYWKRENFSKENRPRPCER